MAVTYGEIERVVAETGMLARGGFVVGPHDTVPAGPDRRPTVCVVMIGNVGGVMWPRFRREARPGRDPLDAWTRATLRPLAERLGAGFVHPSDEPFQPFQRWAQRADDVWQSPIGLMIHPEFGLWHAYRGALLFPEPVSGLARVGTLAQPCLACADRPCLSTCPVDAFVDDGVERRYDHVACRGHVRSGADPNCAHLGCAARRACPIGTEFVYGPDQMAFHMRAFVGDHTDDASA